ncbi:MAG: hypothetical protein AABX38_06695 [Candidatus Micrarchaeota archaeon]
MSSHYKLAKFSPSKPRAYSLMKYLTKRQTIFPVLVELRKDQPLHPASLKPKQNVPMRSLKQEVCGLQQCVNARDSEGVRKSVRSISKLLCDPDVFRTGDFSQLAVLLYDSQYRLRKLDPKLSEQILNFLDALNELAHLRIETNNKNVKEMFALVASSYVAEYFASGLVTSANSRIIFAFLFMAVQIAVFLKLSLKSALEKQPGYTDLVKKLKHAVKSE